MLSVNPGPLRPIPNGGVLVDRRKPTDRQRRSSAISKVILRTSSELAECRSEEIEQIIQNAIGTVSEIEGAEHAGWYLLAESGKSRAFFDSRRGPFSPCSMLCSELQNLPWCFAQLCAGKAVVLDSVDHLLSVAKVDWQILKTLGVRSVALLPSKSASSGRTILILLSMSTTREWSDRIAEQGTLLENIFANAHQRVLAEEESKTTAKRFEHIFLTATPAMALLDHRGHFVSTNNGFQNLLGYSDDELRKMKCDDIINRTNQGEETSLLKYLSIHSTTSLLEKDLIRKDLSVLAVKIKVDLIERPSVKKSLFLINVEDLTEHNITKTELYRRQSEIGVLASQLIQSQENERKRISRELHDDIGQRLSLAASEVALLASQHSESSPGSANRLDALRDELDGLCSDIHELSHDLHSYKLQHLGLKSALKDLCRKISQPRFRVDLYAEDFEEPASKDVALCLYRVAQESLKNAFKHAHTPIVAVTVTKLDNTFYMTIQDSGTGFNHDVPSRGLGLLSMNERVKLVGGHFRLHSLPGRGTEIWVQIPDTPDVKKVSSMGGRPSQYAESLHQ
jgi:PAS domain S-box-containing protein